MEEYEFRGGLIEYFMNMLHHVWYIRLDLLYIRNVTEKKKKYIPWSFKHGKISWDKWDGLHPGHK